MTTNTIRFDEMMEMAKEIVNREMTSIEYAELAKRPHKQVRNKIKELIEQNGLMSQLFTVDELKGERGSIEIFKFKKDGHAILETYFNDNPRFNESKLALVKMDNVLYAAVTKNTERLLSDLDRYSTAKEVRLFAERGLDNQKQGTDLLDRLNETLDDLKIKGGKTHASFDMTDADKSIFYLVRFILEGGQVQ